MTRHGHYFRCGFKTEVYPTCSGFVRLSAKEWEDSLLVCDKETFDYKVYTYKDKETAKRAANEYGREGYPIGEG